MRDGLSRVPQSPLALWVECSPMVQETGVQSQVKSYQKLKKWYLMPSCLTLSIIRYISRIIQGKKRPPLHLSVVANEKGAFRSPTYFRALVDRLLANLPLPRMQLPKREVALSLTNIHGSRETTVSSTLLD